MPVSTMRKLSVVSWHEDTDQLMRALQKLRCVDICRTETPPENDDLRDASVFYSEDAGQLDRFDASAQTAAVHRRIGEAKAAADFLAQFETKKKGLFHPARELSLDEFEAGEAIDAENVVNQAQALSDELTRLQARAGSFRNELSQLKPWEDYPLELPTSSTFSTKTVAGFFPVATDFKALNERLADSAVVLETFERTESGTPASCTVFRQDLPEVEKILSVFGFVRTAVTVTEAEGLAGGRIRSDASRLAACEDRIATLKTRAAELSVKLPEIKAYIDKLTSDEARAEAAAKLRRTDKTVCLTGWIPQKAEKDVTRVLDERGDAYEISDPEEGEEAPILLSNNQFASNFEPVLSMYSLPRYGTYDPTFVMSIFYVIIFGLMFADAGYGLLLTLGCYLFLRLAKPRESMRRFITMFGICGISCAVMGVLFGSYFGNLPSSLANTFLGRETFIRPILFDPMNGQGPMYFLVVSLGIGFIHLSAGLVIKMILLWKQGHRFAAIADVGSWLLIFLGILVYIVLSMLIGVSGMPGLIIALVGVAVVVCTAGRAAKNPVMKFLKGLLGLYDIVSYASDLLSYSRILSLCLASAVIANVVNLLGTLPGAGIGSVFGLLIAFLIGHSLNMALNLLGTFVHTSRLQYIEFFGKFYENGGRMFTPLTPRSKYVIFK